MDTTVEKLTKKIGWHEAEAKRLRAALDVIRELERDGDSERPVRNLAKSTFAQALEIIMRDGPKTTRQIREALKAGNFQSETKNFSAMVNNRLADASRRKKIVKGGSGKGRTWSLPAA